MTGDCESGQPASIRQQLDPGCILKEEPLGFPKGVYMGKNDSEICNLQNQKWKCVHVLPLGMAGRVSLREKIKILISVFVCLSTLPSLIYLFCHSC